MSFRFDKLTIKAQEAVARSQELTAEAGHSQAAHSGEEAAIITEAKRRLASNQPRRSSAEVLARLSSQESK
jgi:hypothetical protein